MALSILKKESWSLTTGSLFGHEQQVITPGNKNLSFLTDSPIFALSFLNNTKTSKK
jgi:hypothetical protein